MRSEDASAPGGVIRAFGNGPECSEALRHQLMVLPGASRAGDAAWGLPSGGVGMVPGAALGAGFGGRFLLWF